MESTHHHFEHTWEQLGSVPPIRGHRLHLGILSDKVSDFDKNPDKERPRRNTDAFVVDVDVHTERNHEVVLYSLVEVNMRTVATIISILFPPLRLVMLQGQHVKQHRWKTRVYDHDALLGLLPFPPD